VLNHGGRPPGVDRRRSVVSPLADRSVSFARVEMWMEATRLPSSVVESLIDWAVSFSSVEAWMDGLRAAALHSSGSVRRAPSED